MKKICLVLSLVSQLGISSCRKDNSDFVIKDSSQPTSSSYYPVIKGIQRQYLVTGDFGSYKYKETITGVTAIFNSKTFYEAISINDGETIGEKGYYCELNNSYTLRSGQWVANEMVDIEYLNDKEAVGFKWTKPCTASGKINEVPAQIIGTIKEKGITKTVQGKTYNNVIHSTVELQYNFMSGFETSATYEMYVAKGIGVILVDSEIDMFGIEINSKTEMLSFKTE